MPNCSHYSLFIQSHSIHVHFHLIPPIHVHVHALNTHTNTNTHTEKQIKKMTGVDVSLTTKAARLIQLRFVDSLKRGVVERSVRKELLGTFVAKARRAYLFHLRMLRRGEVPFVVENARSLLTEEWESGVGEKYKTIYEAQAAHLPPFLLYTRGVHAAGMCALIRRGMDATYERAKAVLREEAKMAY